MPAGRGGGAGCEYVNADLSRREIKDQAARRVADRGLACAVDAEARRAFCRGGGACEDDRAAVLDERQRLLNGEQSPF
jgi:hypothetical protein